jgi:hypothetical protein
VTPHGMHLYTYESAPTRSASSWGRSSVGRAPALQAGGQGFESPRLHHSFCLAVDCLLGFLLKPLLGFDQPDFSSGHQFGHQFNSEIALRWRLVDPRRLAPATLIDY